MEWTGKACKTIVYQFLFMSLFVTVIVAGSQTTTEKKTAEYTKEQSQNAFAKVVLTSEEQSFINTHPKVTIGMLPDFNPFSFNDNGTGTGKGIVYDLLELISKKTGILFECKMDYWPNILPQFKDRQLDVIANISFKEERVPFTLYTTPYYEIPTAVFIRNNFGKYEGLKSLRGKKVAITPEIFYEKELKEFGGLDLVAFHTYDEMTKALAYGKIDALIQSLVIIDQIIQKNAYTNVVMAEEFQLPSVGREDLRFGINTDKPTLRSIIQKGFDAISDMERKRIIHKWLGAKYVKIMEEHSKQSIRFSESEKAYLNKKGTIKMCINPNWMPFERINGQGLHEGVAADIFSLIQERTTLKLKLIETKSYSEMFTFAQKRECDILSLVVETPERKAYMDFTPAYIASPLVIVTRTEELFVENLEKVLDKPLAMIKGVAFLAVLRTHYPGINLIEVPTVLDGLNLVRDGKAYGLIDLLATIAYTLQTEGIVDLKIAGKLDEKCKLSIATRNDEPILNTVMQKALNTVTESEKQEIYNKWFAVKFEQGIDYGLIWKILAGAVTLLLIMMYWNRKLSKAKQQTQTALNELSETQKKLEVLAITDRLTGLYNRVKLDEAVQEELNKSDRLGHPLGIVLLDIDHFKNVNDVHGHQVGDQVLIAMANLLKKSVRKTDTLGRWGGEEFLILCPGTDSEGVVKFTETLRKNIDHHDFPVVKHKTASFGATFYQKGDTINQMIDRADRALYQAKAKGRNKTEFLWLITD